MKRKEFKKMKKATSKTRIAVKIGLLVSLTALLVVASYALSLRQKAEQAVENAFEAVPTTSKSDLRGSGKVEPAKDNVSILLIGVDETDVRHEARGRSDALLVATFNVEEKSVKLLSIPRDSYVYIPKVKYKDRINHAHAFGGTHAAIETVEELLDIPIDYYVKMNFNAFIEVVDALGGIEVEVPYNRLEKDENDKNTIQLVKGVHTLDGRHALALARTRKLDSDLERGKRQQMILQAIIKEMASVKSIGKYGDVIEAVGDNMKTDMTFNEMTSFWEYAKGGMPKIDTINLKGTDDYSRGPYYYQLDQADLENVRQLLQAHLGLIPDSSNLTDGSSSDVFGATDETADGSEDIK
ncbi:LCP family protein [Sporosarcina sp. FSL W8-0480]|uniref:LCP family protein n=1 Tax=Sporosarcina sp. FSL W8-0480 TaxID=2954701 RepID=UPI0030D73A4F